MKSKHSRSAPRGKRSARGKLAFRPPVKRAALLSGTALAGGALGAVVVMVAMPSTALADCNETTPGTVFVCSSEVLTGGLTFDATGNFDVNILDSPLFPENVAKVIGTGGSGAATLVVNASDLDGDYDGYFRFEENTEFTRENGGGTRHVLVVNGGKNLVFQIDGSVWNQDTSSASSTLQFNDGVSEDGDGIADSITITIGATGLLGNRASELIIDVNGGLAGPTVVNNYGEMNGRMDFVNTAGGVTINNYSEDSWNTSGTNDYTNDDDIINNNGGTLNTTGTLSTFLLRGGDDILRNQNGGTIDFGATFTTFLFSDGEDLFENTRGGMITTKNFTNFFFDNPNTFLGAPLPGTESGTQYEDTFRNTRGATFTANGETGFFFGGGDDQFINDRGATFHANGLTLINMGSGDDMFWNQRGAIFNANDGTVIEFGSGDDAFWNRWGSTFNANDVVVMRFGSGDDKFWNVQGGQFNVDGFTTIDFGSSTEDGGDLAYNASVITVDGALWLTNLQTFRNSGVEYGGGLIDMRNDHIGDVVRMWGSDLEFVGGYDSRIGVDVFLGTGIDPDVGSDRFFVYGNSSESTALIVNKLNESPGGTNSDGILVAHSDSVSEEWKCGDGAFCTDGDVFYISDESADYQKINGIGAIRDGFYAWYLQEQWADPEDPDYYLVGGWAPDAHHQPLLTTAMQGLWHDTGGVVEDHVYGTTYPRSGAGGGGADLSYPTYYPTIPGATAPAPGQRMALWGRLSGAWHDSNAEVIEDIGGGQIAYDTSLNQDTYSLMAGLEFRPTGEDGMRLGAFGGWLGSHVRFDSYDASAKLNGGTAGLYAAFTSGGFYADAEFKADFVSIEYATPFVDVSTSGHNLGVLANAGYRMESGASFVEPIASFAYVHTSINPLDDVNNASIEYDNGSSIRAGVGARVGTSFASPGGTTTEVSVLGKLWNEFGGPNTVTITDLNTLESTSFSDGITGIFGEVSGMATVYSADRRTSAFVQGGAKFGDGWRTVTAKAGVRRAF